MEDKLAIINSGGSTNCIGGCVVVEELANNSKFEIKNPAILMTCSGSMVAGVPYVMREYTKLEGIIKNHIASKNSFSNFLDNFRENKSSFGKLVYNLFAKRDIISPKRIWKMIDIKMIIDIFEKEGLFSENNLNKLFASPIDYIIPVINAESGEIKYFSNRNRYLLRNKWELPNVLEAAINLPVAAKFPPFWEPTMVGGLPYFDCPLTSLAQTHIMEVVRLSEEKNLGIEKILIVDNNNINASDSIFDKWFKTRDKKFKERYLENKMEIGSYLENLERILDEKGISVYTIRPNNSSLATLEDSPEVLLSLLYESRKLVDADEKLYEFLVN
ncbi:MAG: hypothetical protein ABFQ65_03545 [Nanoarchaeota archaeon]